MDYTFQNIHPNEDHFLKGLTKLFTKRIAKKTAEKAGLSKAQTKDFQDRTQKAISTGALGKKITSLNRAGNVVAGGALTALTAGLATGAIGLGGAGAATAAGGSGALGGLKILKPKGLPTTVSGISKISDVIKPVSSVLPSKSKTKTGELLGKAVTAVKDLAKEKAPVLIEKIKQEGIKELSEALDNNRTAPELLPKTRQQNRSEQAIIDAGNTPQGNLTFAGFVEQNLIYVLIGLAFLIVIGFMVKKK